MLPSSFVVLLTGVVLGGLGLLAFAWAWRRGHFGDLDAQSRVIFDERDYRLERPWESPEQREERRRLYGEALAPEPGEWGGGS
jgi:cbb3-type cytochrome oxidase maturation protein